MDSDSVVRAEVLIGLLWEEKSQKKVTHSTVEEMSARTFIKQDDIISTLQVPRGLKRQCDRCGCVSHSDIVPVLLWMRIHRASIWSSIGKANTSSTR